MHMGGSYYGHIQANDNSRLHLGDNHYYGDRERLKYVSGALFDAYGVDHQACHPETRKDLLVEIERWAERSPGKCIFWLNGMAGTGKSTIAYTVAQRLSERRPPSRATLGASFFFKRGERNRASAVSFFPTIVHQLRRKIPGLAAFIDRAIDADPEICHKALGEQFKKLLEGPLRELGDSLSAVQYVVVVDALDECQKEDDIRTLLQLWSRLSQNPHIPVRWFLTSRPELAIQLGFSRMLTDVRHDVILHEMPPPAIKHDIFVFLADSFSRIREDYDLAPLSDTPLAEDWPGTVVLEELTHMAVPLFIIAATICRFVQDQDFDPRDQLRVILDSRSVGQISELGQTYLPILERVVSSLANVTTRHQVHHEFRLIVGTIITVAEPLSRLDLAVLLRISLATVTLRLRPLHSVLQIPLQTEAPVRSLHLSFGEFLSSEEVRDQPFWVDRTAAHAVLLTKCLELLSQPSPVGLCENMCQLSYPGQPRRDLAHTAIHDRLSSTMQYACRYWTYHVQQKATRICDDDEVHNFLQKHFLHWLEALSLLDCLGEAIQHVNALQSLLSVKDSTHVATFLEDARRFVLANRFIANQAPLQLYSSAIIFSPQSSIVRKVCGQIPAWIKKGPITPSTWKLELQTIEGHKGSVEAVAFSPDGSLLASGSVDKTVRLWDVKTGQEVQKLEGYTGPVYIVAFSPDGSQLASGSVDGTVRLWDVKTGQEVQKLKGHTEPVQAVALSPDGSLVALGSVDGTVRLWDTKTGQEVQKLEGHTRSVQAVALSPDGSQLASGSVDGTVRLWDVKTGQEVQKLEGHTISVQAITFSPDGSLVASGSYDGMVRLWDVKTGQEVQKLEGHTGWVHTVTFSPDGSLVASGSNDGMVQWDVKTGQEVQKLEGHTSWVKAVAFSPDGSLLASGCDEGTIRLWDVKTGQEVQKLEGYTGPVYIVAFSPDGAQLASAFDGGTIRLWDTKTGQEVQKLEGYTSWVHTVAFSPDGSLLASESNNGTIRLWDVKTGQEVQKLEGHTSWVEAVAFSPDGAQLASGSVDGTIRLWDVKAGQQIRVLEDDISIREINFTKDGRTLLTNRGNIPIQTSPVLPKSSESRGSNSLVLKDDWIEHWYKRLLWLPHEYRSDIVAIRGNLLAIGCQLGLVNLQITPPEEVVYY